VILTCPRCDAVARAPGRWSDSWSCPVHGGIAPLHPPVVASDAALRQTAQRASVPVWLPWPLPQGWLLSGLQFAGDEHTGPVAVTVACSGPHPLPVDHPDERSADLLLIAEQPGVGLGAHLAGLPDVDPGDALGAGAPNLKLVVAGHDSPLWALPVDGVAAYVGEASGVWLWALTWPASAAAVLLERFELRDARDLAHPLGLPFGALSPRLG
jgi:hypothetical protein